MGQNKQSSGILRSALGLRVREIAAILSHPGTAEAAATLAAAGARMDGAAAEHKAAVDAALKAEIDKLTKLMQKSNARAAGPRSPKAKGGAGSQPKKQHPLQDKIKTVKSPLELVPANAEQPPFFVTENGCEYGVNYEWTEGGETVRLRIHGPDRSAPEGSNSRSGVTFRLQVGKRYLDREGNDYHPQSHNPKSPHHNPDAANATHIPWPKGVPMPKWHNT